MRLGSKGEIIRIFMSAFQGTRFSSTIFPRCLYSGHLLLERISLDMDSLKSDFVGFEVELGLAVVSGL